VIRVWGMFEFGLVLLHLLGCEGGEPPGAIEEEGSAGSVREIGARTVHSVAWDTIFQIGGSPEDSVLLQPGHLTARDERVYVFDGGDRSLKAFDLAGELVWRLGRRGEGPGEFLQVIDLEVGPEGNVWILDGGAARIAIVSSDGEWVGTRSLGDEMTRDVLPLEGGMYLLVSHAPGDRMFSAYDRSGRRIEQVTVPDPDIGRAYWAGRQTMSAVSSSDHTSWVAPYLMGDLFLVYDGRKLRCQGELVEGGPFPRERYRELPPIWLVMARMDEDHVYTLAKGETDLALRILDVYDAHDCRYLYSLELPGEFRRLALTGDTFVLQVRDALYPTILGLRLIDR